MNCCHSPRYCLDIGTYLDRAAEPAATIYFYFVQVVASTLFISSTDNRYFPDCTESLNKGEAFFQIEVTYVLLTCLEMLVGNFFYQNCNYRASEEFFARKKILARKILREEKDAFFAKKILRIYRSKI